MVESASTACGMLLLLLLSFLAAGVRSQSCTTGIIQMVDMYESCPPGDRNGIVGACGVAFDVSVDQKGMISLAPLVQGSTNWSGPGSDSGTFQCKDMNATGLMSGKNTEARLTLYNDVGGVPSLLSAVQGSKIRLQPSKTYGYQAPAPNCTYTYMVVKGCVLGISAPSSPPPCPKGSYVAQGVGNVSYCAPCAPGQHSSSENAASCTPCPKGTEKPNYGGMCTACPPSMYSSAQGAVRCEYCMDENTYTDGQFCKACPEGSWVTRDKKQCQVCSAGKRCCMANPSVDCPPCTKGFKSGRTFTSIFAFDGAFPIRCQRLSPAVCTSSFNLTITPSCKLVWTANTTQNSNTAFCYTSPTETEIAGPRLDTKRDFTGFTAYTDFSVLTANVTGLRSPFINFTFSDLKCTYQYRAISGLAARIVGAYPVRCPYGTPGCPFELNTSSSSLPLCPPGRFLEKRVCLPCPPGTYSDANSSAPCTRCPAGKFAQGYGNVRCKTCRPGTSADEGTNMCVQCLEGSYSGKGAATCTICPSGTFSSQGWPYCLGNNAGSVCCGAGTRCKGAKCPPQLPTTDTELTAVLKLNNTSARTSACRKISFLSCLGKNGMVAMSASNMPSGSSGYINIKLYPVAAPSCVLDRFPTLSHELNGVYTGTTSARASDSLDNTNFALNAFTSNSRSYINITVAPGKQQPAELATCFSTFELIAGYAFDLMPPANATCPRAARNVTALDRTFCTFCSPGNRKRGSDCTPCGPGTFQNLMGATGCRTCAAGTFGGSTSNLNCERCRAGTYSNKGWEACKPCPPNTYSGEGARSCTKCPAGLMAPEGSSACSTPFKP